MPTTINFGSTFLVTNSDGFIDNDSPDGEGLYSDDTRFVSTYKLRINGRSLHCISVTQLSHWECQWEYRVCLNPLPIHSVVNAVDEDCFPNISVNVRRKIGVRAMNELIELHVLGELCMPIELTAALGSDFADLFEVRTQQWQRRDGIETKWNHGQILETRYQQGGFIRRCRTSFKHDDQVASYANGAIHLPIETRNGQWSTALRHDLVVSDCRLRSDRRDCGEAEEEYVRWVKETTQLHAADKRLTAAWERASTDLCALRIFDGIPHGRGVPAAGSPWFMALFGRDATIVSLQTLFLNPMLAVSTLKKLGELQATMEDSWIMAEPGKLPHEMRVGEWTYSGRSPHRPYYGTHDTPALYMMLCAQANKWLGDTIDFSRFYPTVLGCHSWMNKFGDCDNDGFQEYNARVGQSSQGGLGHFSWKDNDYSIPDSMGAIPRHPIGTCEMQGYAYAAMKWIADLYGVWGNDRMMYRSKEESDVLREKFFKAYWMNDEETFAIALDGNKKQVASVSSNPGHCLWTGIAHQEVGYAVGQRMLKDDLFSGWGIRTLSSHHAAYDPISYHCGSVWPHDTIIAAAGLRRYGNYQGMWDIINGLLDAAMECDGQSLPELFSGVSKEENQHLLPYPYANKPQAWAAGSVIHAVSLLLGLEPDVPRGKLYLDPALPPWCPQLELSNMLVGSERLSIRASRNEKGATDVSVSGTKMEIIIQPALSI